MEEKLKLFLKTMVKNNGSDLHLKSGSQPRLRVHGTLKILGQDILTDEMMDRLAQEIRKSIETWTSLTFWMVIVDSVLISFIRWMASQQFSGSFLSRYFRLSNLVFLQSFKSLPKCSVVWYW